MGAGNSRKLSIRAFAAPCQAAGARSRQNRGARYWQKGRHGRQNRSDYRTDVIFRIYTHPICDFLCYSSPRSLRSPRRSSSSNLEATDVKESLRGSLEQQAGAVRCRLPPRILRASVRPTECNPARDVALSGHIDRLRDHAARRPICICGSLLRPGNGHHIFKLKFLSE